MTLARDSAPLAVRLQPVKFIELTVVEFFIPLHKTEKKRYGYKYWE
jgi:hypothetical protein